MKTQSTKSLLAKLKTKGHERMKLQDFLTVRAMLNQPDEMVILTELAYRTEDTGKTIGELLK